jgi:hypothetical protein
VAAAALVLGIVSIGALVALSLMAHDVAPPGIGIATTPPPTPTWSVSPLTTTSVAPMASPTPSPAPSPTQIPSSTPRPTPTTTPDPLAGTGWLTLAHTSYWAIDWSPSGEFLLFRSSHKVLLIRAADSQTVRTYDAPNDSWAGSTWVDDSAFILYIRETTSQMSVGHGVLGTIANAVVTEVDVPTLEYAETDIYPVGTSNGHGAIAYRTDVSQTECGFQPCWRYRVWTRDGLTQEVPGLPVAWSTDGTRLAVIHQRVESPATSKNHGYAAGWDGYTGWLEVLSWPNLESVYRDRRLMANENLNFDPAAEHVAFRNFDGYWLLTLGNGKRREIGAFWWDRPVWDKDGRLFVAGDRQVLALNPDTTVALEWRRPHTIAVGSAAGKLVVFTPIRNQGNGPSMTLLRAGITTNVELPAALGDWQYFWAYPSDDGHSIAVAVYQDSGLYSVLLTRVP